MKKELNEQQRRELNTESFKASEESQMNEEEWQARIDLAALYRLAAHFGYDDLIWNHITMRVPGTDHQFLLNKFGLLYNEVTASNLIKVDENGNVLSGPQGREHGWFCHPFRHSSCPSGHESRVPCPCPGWTGSDRPEKWC